MTTALYQEFEADTCFKGDTNKMDGTLEVTGTSTLTGIVTMTAGQAAIKVSTVGAITGTTVGAAWTSGAPLLTDAQKCLTITVGSTNYKIPVWTV